MKFQLVLDNSGRKIVLYPEDTAEATLLALICDPNKMEEDRRSTASISVETTSDRPPYKKVTQLVISL